MQPEGHVMPCDAMWCHVMPFVIHVVRIAVFNWYIYISNKILLLLLKLFIYYYYICCFICLRFCSTPSWCWRSWNWMVVLLQLFWAWNRVISHTRCKWCRFPAVICLDFWGFPVHGRIMFVTGLLAVWQACPGLCFGWGVCVDSWADS